ncbi:MAG TPA: hypothetical protein VI298_04220 [Geobacteraceae bacterium]
MQLLLRIANEEKKHYNIMENFYDFVLAPQSFLAWGEFSNLRELWRNPPPELFLSRIMVTMSWSNRKYLNV